MRRLPRCRRNALGPETGRRAVLPSHDPSATPTVPATLGRCNAAAGPVAWPLCLWRRRRYGGLCRSRRGAKINPPAPTGEPVVGVPSPTRSVSEGRPRSRFGLVAHHLHNRPTNTAVPRAPLPRRRGTSTMHTELSRINAGLFLTAVVYLSLTLAATSGRADEPRRQGAWSHARRRGPRRGGLLRRVQPGRQAPGLGRRRGRGGPLGHCVLEGTPHAEGRRRGEDGHFEDVWGLAFSPDGKRWPRPAHDETVASGT